MHLDLVGPLPPSQGNSYCVTMVDRFTSWAAAVASQLSLSKDLTTLLNTYSIDQSTVALSITLLGLRTAFKEDIHAITAKLVYATSLRIPGEFFVPTATGASPQLFVEQINLYFRDILPTPASRHEAKSINIHFHLTDCSHVFLRHDGVKKPL